MSPSPLCLTLAPQLLLFLLGDYQVEILPVQQQGHEPGRGTVLSGCSTGLNQSTKLKG